MIDWLVNGQYIMQFNKDMKYLNIISKHFIKCYEFISNDVLSLFPMVKNQLYNDHENTYESLFVIIKIIFPSSATSIRCNSFKK